MCKNIPKKRYKETLRFLQTVLLAPTTILDLGVRSPSSKIVKENRYAAVNTQREDLDLIPEIVKEHQPDVVAAFEIFEYLH